MSTRCQIGFFESADEKRSIGQVLIYRHSDGYPEAVLPTLINFCKWFDRARGLNDVSYATARCVQWLTNIADGKAEDYARLVERDGLGYGIDTFIHGDIEYFYHVSPNEIKVYEVDGPENQKLIQTLPLVEGKKS